MGNTLLTPSIIAKESIMVLENELVMGGLVHRDFSDEFANVGDTITVKKPATFESKVHDGSNIVIQNATEGSVSVVMDTILDVSFAVTSKEATLSIQDFSKQFVVPAMQAHAQKIDSLLASKYVDFPYYAVSTATPVISDFAEIGRILNVNKAPVAGRNCVLDPTAHAKYVTLDAVMGAEKSGSTEALRNASLGRILGLDTYMDQNVAAHTKGTAVGGGSYTLTANAGAKTGTLAASGNGLTYKVGDLFTLAGIAGQYVVTKALATEADGSGTLEFYPALPAAAAGKVLTLVASHTANLAFHRNAIALVTRPLMKPLGANGEVMSYNGLSARATYGYNQSTKTDTVSIDILLGIKTLTPELGVRFIRL